MEETSPASREEFSSSPFGPSAIGRNDAVALDRDALKLLASDTRLDILKTLRQRRMTVSELSSSLALGKSTVFEHLNKLVEGGLILRHDDPRREWVYYELAPKAKRLFNPVSAKIVLMLSSVIGLALAALVGWALVSSAGPGLTVDVAPDVALAGEPTVFEVGMTSGGQAFGDADLWLLTAEQYRSFRDGGEPMGRPLPGLADANGVRRVSIALPPGDYYIAAMTPEGDLASRDGSGLVRVTAARLNMDPFPLIVGADEERPVRLWLTHEGRVLDAGTLRIEGATATFDAGLRALRVRDPLETSRFDLLGVGDLAFTFQPDGEGTVAAPVASSAYVDLPRVSVAPGFLVAGQPANLTVTVWHEARGTVAEAPVRVHVGSAEAPDIALTDARGVARLAIPAQEAEGRVLVYVGDYLVGRLPVLRLMGVEAQVTPIGLELWAKDVATGKPIADAAVERNGERLLVTDTSGRALVTQKGPLVIRAPGYAPYGVGVPGYEETTVHWVSTFEDETAPSRRVVSVTEVSASDVRIPLGGTVHVTARVHNPTDRPILERAVLTVDGARWSVQDAPLAPGETRTVVFPVFLREPGLHRLSVNDGNILEVHVETPPRPVASLQSVETKDAPLPWMVALAAVATVAFALRRR